MTRGRQIARVLRRGFTLIEMIVVISVIAILAAIALMVGSNVMQRGRIDLTRNLLRMLDQTQDSYMQDRDGKIPYKWTDTSAQKNEFGIIDGRINPTTDRGYSDEVVEPSTTFYLLAISGSTSADSIVKGLDSRFVVRAPITNAPAPSTYLPTNFANIYTRQSAMPQTSTVGEQVFGLVVKDAWGNAIRFVHPKFQSASGSFWDPTTPTTPPAGHLEQPSASIGRDTVFNASGTFKLRQNGADVPIQFRRSYRPFDPNATVPSPHQPPQIGDADEGLCQGSRGYFYSVGLDGDAGTRGDNVYLDAKPQFPKETAKY